MHNRRDIGIAALVGCTDLLVLGGSVKSVLLVTVEKTAAFCHYFVDQHALKVVQCAKVKSLTVLPSQEILRNLSG
jgi:hypothetical protein